MRKLKITPEMVLQLMAKLDQAEGTIQELKQIINQLHLQAQAELEKDRKEWDQELALKASHHPKFYHYKP